MMAKSRNRKDKKNKKAKSSAPPLKAAPAEKNRQEQTAAEIMAKNPPAPKNPGQEKKSSPQAGVRISTCIAGMFLTLCLGLYIGSLLPDLTSDIHKPAPAAPVSAMPEGSAAKPDKPAPKATPENASSNSPKLAISPSLQQHISHLEKEAAQNPRDAKILADLGNAYFDTGQTRKAIGAYEKSLAIDPVNPDVLTDLGIMHREEKNYDLALECFKKAVALNPKHLNALFNQGVVLGLDQHRHDEAKAAWRKVLEISPEARAPDGKRLSDLIMQIDSQQHD